MCSPCDTCSPRKAEASNARRSQMRKAGFGFYNWIYFLVALTFCTQPVAAETNTGNQHRILRIAADPNNLPFSNERLEGYENKIAALIGRELHAEIQYTWRAQRRGFFRETLKAGDCDLVMGVPIGIERALTTKPYYRSSYVFVQKKAEGPVFESLEDPRLRRVKIGVQLIGDDGANTPPAHALASRGI